MNEDAMQPRIHLLGAGITGLSLATFLRARRIPFEIFDTAPRPTGHNYGLTLQPWGYEDLLTGLTPKIASVQSFRKSVAVDRLIDGNGKISSAHDDAGQIDSKETAVRASDSVLRNLLAEHLQQNQVTVSWSHRLSSATSTKSGIRLEFENGRTATAPITIDATGERQALLSKLISEEQPLEVLPYAVYHGSRYVRSSEFESTYSDLFESKHDNVREWSVQCTLPHKEIVPPVTTTFYIQVSRAYIEFEALPTPIKKEFSSSQTKTEPDKEKYIEIRYTISRPSISTSSSSSTSKPDPTFNPNRSKSEAKQIPQAFYHELTTLLSSSSSSTSATSHDKNNNTFPQSLKDLLDPSKVQKDRVLNWLLRIHHPTFLSGVLKSQNNLVVIGDAAHPLPILGSNGANIGMQDAYQLARWIDSKSHERSDSDSTTGGGEEKEYDVSGFYDECDVFERWEGAARDCRLWLKRVHGQLEDENENENKGGKRDVVAAGGGKL